MEDHVFEGRDRPGSARRIAEAVARRPIVRYRRDAPGPRRVAPRASRRPEPGTAHTPPASRAADTLPVAGLDPHLVSPGGGHAARRVPPAGIDWLPGIDAGVVTCPGERDRLGSTRRFTEAAKGQSFIRCRRKARSHRLRPGRLCRRPESARAGFPYGLRGDDASSVADPATRTFYGPRA